MNPRRGSRKLRMLPVDSRKNYLQDFGTMAGNANGHIVNLAQGVDAATLAVTNSVEDGAEIHRLTIQCNLYWTSAPAAPRHVLILLRKNEDNLLPALTPAGGSSIGGQSWKDRIFYLEQAQPGIFSAGGNQMPYQIIFRIPKGFKKMSFGDRWELVIQPLDALAGETLDFCVLASYKWFK